LGSRLVHRILHFFSNLKRSELGDPVRLKEEMTQTVSPHTQTELNSILSEDQRGSGRFSPFIFFMVRKSSTEAQAWKMGCLRLCFSC